MHLYRYGNICVCLTAAAMGGAAARGVENDPLAPAAVSSQAPVGPYSLNDDLLYGPPLEVTVGAPQGPSVQAGGGCDVIGSMLNAFAGTNRNRGNYIEILDFDAELEEFGLCVQFLAPVETNITFTIHENTVEDPARYLKIVEKVLPVRGTPGQPECFLSGEIHRISDPQNPVVLMKNRRYILNAGWGQAVSIQYWQDSQQYPLPFLHGDVLGLYTLNLAPPLPDEITRTPFTGGAHWMELCFKEGGGACCIESDCEFLLREECLAANGDFTAERVTCEQVNELGGCGDLPIGACCFDVGCEVTNIFACLDQGGTFKGRATTCEQHCPQGVCCVDDECLDGISRESCDDLDGHYRGDELDCNVIEPECGFGACCLPEGCLDNVEEAFCEIDLNGVFRGDGSVCKELDPLCPGACCWELRCDEGLSPESCEARLNGVFLGYLPTRCRDFPDCGAVERGSCCLEDGRCFTVRNGAVCGRIGGPRAVFTANGECRGPCTTAPCCLPEGCRQDLSPFECVQEGGRVANDCGDCPAETEACCFGDGTCSDLDPDRCDDEGVGGTPQGPGTDCANTPCAEREACCFEDARCRDLAPSYCVKQKGNPQGENTSCRQTQCPFACDVIKKLSAKCKNGKLTAKLKTNLPPDSEVEVVLDGGNNRFVLIKAKGKGKVTYRSVDPGDHVVSLVRCPEIQKQVTCR